ncbi:VOC family protein [Actinotalea sp. M2MS4P-6]|uniref:VOC family protein n=1 Tax=Actinotalea sp. M2MS4P-6 TaxID=2983762 RepID=UPI0021E41B52|nr:VOC family protein [Actinotalea sp. M2MS4P-6]MCV2396047.1 VOC family protein [Actinotalea sp. M2MS4P-6]
MPRITVFSIFVDDQREALAFYTDVLGFRLKADMPMGEHAWLTVVDPAHPDGTEISLEPAEHPAVGPFRAALAADGIPFTSFGVDDLDAEVARLTELGVRFTQPPLDFGPVRTAVLDDTCGNLIQLAQHVS